MLASADPQKVQENKQWSIQSINKAISKGNLGVSIKNVFTNKNVNYVYIGRSSFCTSVLLSCVKFIKL